MRIDLKCGEYLDFYKVKKVEILDNDAVKITGSFGKGKRNIIHQTRLTIVKNIKELNRFLEKEMKFFQADGVCQYCGSLNVLEQGNSKSIKKLNEPKKKKKYTGYAVAGYKCNACGKLFSELKPVDLVIYYK